MVPKSRIPAHPGQILFGEFILPLALSRSELASRLAIPELRLMRLLEGAESVDAEIAHRLASAFGTTAELWLNLQRQHDLAKPL
jgi:antitoxin HigA-1